MFSEVFPVEDIIYISLESISRFDQIAGDDSGDDSALERAFLTLLF